MREKHTEVKLDNKPDKEKENLMGSEDEAENDSMDVHRKLEPEECGS